MSHKLVSLYIGDGEYYTRTDADTVIAELEERIADGDKDFEMANHQNERLLKIVRHQKYKRCLAMAMWCKMSARENDTRMCLPMKCTLTRHEEYLYFIGYYHKWHKRWLGLAEQFKGGR